MNYTTYHNLELIKLNIIDIFAEYLRYTVRDKTEEEKVSALGKFVQDIKPIKNLSILTKIRKRYEKHKPEEKIPF